MSVLGTITEAINEALNGLNKPNGTSLTPSSGFTNSVVFQWKKVETDFFIVLGYTAQFQYSIDGSNWGDIQENQVDKNTVSITYDTSNIPYSSYCRARVKIRALGEESNYTNWVSGRKLVVTKPALPTRIECPSFYSNNIIIEWNGGSAGINNPCVNYTIAYQIGNNTDGWSEEETVTTNSRKYTFNLLQSAKNIFKFKIRSNGQLLNGDYSKTYYVLPNTAPETPELLIPSGWGKAINNDLFVQVRLGNDAENNWQYIKVDNAISDSKGINGDIVSYVFKDFFKGKSKGRYGLTVYSFDGELSSSIGDTVWINIEDNPIKDIEFKKGDIVRVEDFIKLRQATSAIASYYGISYPTFTDYTMDLNYKPAIKAVHLTELQYILKEAAKIKDIIINFSEIKKGDRIKAQHFEEIRQAILKL